MFLACFENGNHEGHDYNIFRSEAGGACDCGDASVMHKSGFCSHHGPNRVIPPPPPPGFLAAGKVCCLFVLVIIIVVCECTKPKCRFAINLVDEYFTCSA